MATNGSWLLQNPASNQLRGKDQRRDEVVSRGEQRWDHGSWSYSPPWGEAMAFRNVTSSDTRKWRAKQKLENPKPKHMVPDKNNSCNPRWACPLVSCRVSLKHRDHIARMGVIDRQHGWHKAKKAMFQVRVALRLLEYVSWQARALWPGHFSGHCSLFEMLWPST